MPDFKSLDDDDDLICEFACHSSQIEQCSIIGFILFWTTLSRSRLREENTKGKGVSATEWAQKTTQKNIYETFEWPWKENGGMWGQQAFNRVLKYEICRDKPLLCPRFALKCFSKEKRDRRSKCGRILKSVQSGCWVDGWEFMALLPPFVCMYVWNFHNKKVLIGWQTLKTFQSLPYVMGVIASPSLCD